MIKYLIWKYWNFIDWIILTPIQTKFDKCEKFWYNPITPNEGYQVWKIIHK